MSYQFEDDSALEELLNQQLDRRKQQPKASSQQQSQIASGRPSTATLGPSSLTVGQPPLQSRPSAASASSNRKPSLNTDEQQQQQQPSKSKLSTWLAAKQPPPFQAIERPAGDSIGRENDTLNRPAQPALPINYRQQNELADELDLSIFEEDKLQEMSKQRLIQLIVNQIQSLVKDLHRTASIGSTRQAEQLKADLEAERRRVQLIEATQQDRIKLEEQKWTQIVEQLGKRLEFSENEMKNLLEGQREHLLKVDQQHQRDLQKLTDHYEMKLKNERQQFDELTRRRNEMHQLEMESRLRVDCNLTKLDTIQSEWNKSIETTIRQLDNHFKSVESLLDKQTVQVNGTNVNLLEKTRHLNEHYGKFEQANMKVNELADCLNQLMPKVTLLHERNESFYQVTCDKLEEFNKRSEVLLGKEQEIERIKSELLATRDKFNEDRMKLALDLNRVELKEEKLNESLQSSREMESKLNEQKNEQLKLDNQLRVAQSGLDIKANELREQNYDLHLLRKRLTNQKEELLKSQQELEAKRNQFEDQTTKLGAHRKKLYSLRVQVNRELDQLRRLQKSLVCSLCLSRLYSSSDLTAGQTIDRRRLVVGHRQSANVDVADDQDDINEIMSTIQKHKPSDESANADIDSHMFTSKTIANRKTIGRINSNTGSIGHLEVSQMFPFELATLREQVDEDQRRLIGESKYIEMISTAN